ncbi:hypothetical protein CL656_05315 [bacterium]|nr:hypothetical protein [bacterium]|tara:strand:+ start:2675 stop:3355 length:681 start_codon:yes stop_codon:yes gene_type:complete
MAGIEFNFSNLFMFFSSIIPFLLVFFMVMISIFDYNIKGFIYIFGLFIAYGLTIPLQNTLNTKLVEYNNNDNENNIKTVNQFINKLGSKVNPLCYLFNFSNKGLGYLAVPSYNSVIIAFTFAYLVGPMMINNTINYLLIIFLFIILVIDSSARVTNNCTNAIGVVFGIILGLLIGGFYVMLLNSAGYNDLLYNDDFVSNKVACTKPSKQQFKCAVYRNGELLRNIN